MDFFLEKFNLTRLFPTCTLLFLLITPSCISQTLTTDVLSTSLCRAWRIQKIVQEEKISGNESQLNDFVLIIHSDHSVQQGMSPDGLISGTWMLDEEKRIFTVKDNETGSLYPMKILSITADSLILQDQSPSEPLTIFYLAN